MKYILTLIAVTFQLSLVAQQTCDCNADLRFVIEKIENEHPGFSNNVNRSNIATYTRLKDSLSAKTANISKDDCQKIIRKYLSFIKDKHLQIYDPRLVDETKHENNLLTNRLPEYQNLSPTTAYIKVPSFDYRLWKQLDQFYDSITPILKSKKAIILDIRNNSGGGERMYNQLVKILKTKAKTSKIGVIFNKNCASACEEVALIATNSKHIQTFGENTNGQFAYGFIKSYRTPECGFKFIITTKKYPKRQQYEFIGVAPEVALDKNSESQWISIVAEKLNQ
ncbi:MAG: hypothetical protein IR153_03980 [Flavobacterium sp.]|nr:hypothetical protein [Flavobacterium sp.]